MGLKKQRIINDKTSIIRPPAPPAPPKKRTTVQDDANKAVDEAVKDILLDGLTTYLGYDPVRDQSMFRTADGETVCVEGPADYSVHELHKFLQRLAEKELSDTTVGDDEVGYTPVKRPDIRQPTTIKTPKTPKTKTPGQILAEEEERILNKNAAELDRLGSMACHEIMDLGPLRKVMRVPGGLIYSYTKGYGSTESVTSTFVPWTP